MQDEMEKLARWHDGMARWCNCYDMPERKHYTDAAATIRAAMARDTALTEALSAIVSAATNYVLDERTTRNLIVGIAHAALKKGPAHD